MATRKKEEAIVDEAQKIYVVVRRILAWTAFAIFAVAVALWLGSLVKGALGSGTVPGGIASPSTKTVANLWLSAWFIIVVVCGGAKALYEYLGPGTTGEKVKRAIPTVLYTVALIFAGSFATQWFESRSTLETSAHKPAELQEQRLPMAPHGDTVRMSAWGGYHIVFVGTGFDAYCVYPGGEVEQLPNPSARCSQDGVSYWFARDTTGKPNSVVWQHRPN